MAVSIPALVEPSLLVWARTSSRLDQSQAARKLKITVELLNAWESGEQKPTVAKLRKMAEVYKRPLAVFYLSEPPKTFDAMRLSDFRTLEREGGKGISPELAAQISWASERREIALDLMEEIEDPFPDLPLILSRADSAEDAAARLREHLGISLEQQFSWASAYPALNAWRAAIEKMGILTFQSQKVPLSQMRGVAVNETPLPFILLNGGDRPHAKIFTVLHELVHILLKEEGLCDTWDGTRTTPLGDRAEVFANHVAGAILVPRAALLSEPLVHANRGTLEWSDEDIHELTSKYVVSAEALIRRLLAIDAVSLAFYRKKREAFQSTYGEKQKKPQGHPPQYRIVLGRNGMRYTRLVLDAYYGRAITASDLSNFLGMKLNHLAEMERAVLN